jgi:hypothetical protein
MEVCARVLMDQPDHPIGALVCATVLMMKRSGGEFGLWNRKLRCLRPIEMAVP